MAQQLRPYPAKKAMKQEYRQIFHEQTPSGWQPGFEARVRLHPEDAAAVNRKFNETGVKCVAIREPRPLKNNVSVVA